MWKYRYTSEFYHHGIRGQKWGQRNGPPYPLRSHSVSERKASWRKSLDKNKQEKYTKDKKKHKLTDKQKKALKIGTAVVAAALIAYGTYKFVDSGNFHRYIVKGKQILNKTTDLPFKKNAEYAKDMSADEIAHTFFGKINPGFAEGVSGTTKNCRRCTFAYEISRRGYDVKATKTLSGSGQTGIGLRKAVNGKGILSAYKDYIKAVSEDSTPDNIEKQAELFGEKISNGKAIKFKTMFPENEKEATKLGFFTDQGADIYEALSTMPERSRGELSLRRFGGGGHSVAWEIIDGKPIVFDFQTGEMYKTAKEIEDNLTRCVKSADFTRLDNIDLNTDFLQRWVTND